MRPRDPGAGKTYYQHWLATLERLIAAKGVATSELLHRYRDGLPCGVRSEARSQAIELTAEDFG